MHASISIAVCNRSSSKVDATVVRAKEEGNLPLEGHHAVSDFVNALSKPRKIIILVQAGAAVDSTIEQLSACCEVSHLYMDAWINGCIPSMRLAKLMNVMCVNVMYYLQEGDIIIDGGNEWFPNSIRRNEELALKGINFVGMGISGGEEV
jgi:6-phosphogluconate dehydrogenase